MLNLSVQLSLGEEFGPAHFQVGSPTPADAPSAPLSEDGRERRLTQILETALSHLFLAVIANEKLQESIDDEEVREGAAVLQDFSLPIRAFIEATVQEWQLDQARVEKRTVARFGGDWKLRHLLQYEDDEDPDSPAATSAHGYSSSLTTEASPANPHFQPWPSYLQLVRTNSITATTNTNSIKAEAAPTELKAEATSASVSQSQAEPPL